MLILNSKNSLKLIYFFYPAYASPTTHITPIAIEKNSAMTKNVILQQFPSSGLLQQQTGQQHEVQYINIPIKLKPANIMKII